MDNKWLWIGGAAVLVLLFVMSRGGGTGAQVIPAPDTSAETAARFSFAAAGLDSLSKVATDALGYASEERVATTVANAQVSVEQSRNNALVASANAYADAQKYTAHQQERAQSNSSMWGAIGSVAAGVLSLFGL